MNITLEVTGSLSKRFLTTLNDVIAKLNSDKDFPWNSSIMKRPYYYNLNGGEYSYAVTMVMVQHSEFPMGGHSSTTSTLQMTPEERQELTEAVYTIWTKTNSSNCRPRTISKIEEVLIGLCALQYGKEFNSHPVLKKSMSLEEIKQAIVV